MLDRLKTSREPLFRDICSAIKTYIIDQGLKPGDRVPTEMELCERLNISRTALREAMKALDTVGIVSVEIGRGTFVRGFDFVNITEHLPYALSLSDVDVLELLETRQVLELHCLKTAIIRLSAEDIFRLNECVKAMEPKASLGEPFIDEDMEFHKIIAQASGNKVILRLLTVFWDMRRKMPISSDLPACYKEHLEILEGIHARNYEQAYKAMAAHFKRGFGEVDSLGVN
jgi:GntR family transcriptional regulator, transcriptional repressor for pyruvate dehydrogenase complex